jgi:phage virion morphogenesis protein
MSDKNIIIDDKELQYQFKKLIDRGTNTRPLMQRLQQQMYSNIMNHFEKEGQDNRRWPSLKAATIRARQRKNHWPGKILNIHGSSGLIGSITQPTVTNNEAVVGTNLKYAAAHEFGYKPKKIPKRPFLHQSQREIDGFTNMVKQYILDTKQ